HLYALFFTMSLEIWTHLIDLIGVGSGIFEDFDLEFNICEPNHDLTCLVNGEDENSFTIAWSFNNLVLKISCDIMLWFILKFKIDDVILDIIKKLAKTFILTKDAWMITQHIIISCQILYMCFIKEFINFIGID
ncbi:hypothetical protein ACJX0J_031366, partial [Zea mays]